MVVKGRGTGTQGESLVRPAVRASVRPPAVLGLLALLLLLRGTGLTGATYAAGEVHHAGIVIQFAGGSTRTFCVPFTGDTINGLDLLLKTGLDVKLEAYGMGAMICKIGTDGCDYPGQPCACLSYGQDGAYWSYHHLKDGKWKTSALGAGSYKVHDGEIDGWAWSNGAPPSQAPGYSSLCGLAVPTATTPPSSLSTATRLPTRTATPPLPPTVTRPVTRTRTPRPQVSPTFTAQSAPRGATATISPPLPPVATATHTETHVSPTFTVIATSTPTVTPPVAIDTATPTQRPTFAAGPTTTVLPTPVPAPPTDSAGESTARTIAAILGAAVSVGFLLWRGLLLAARGRGRTGG